MEYNIAQMAQKYIRVSLVIPAYNEEHQLKECLDRVAAQTVKPFEVIVIDNNSDDHTAAIAKLYPFVKLVSEPKQGVVFARDRGFNEAKGDVIGRIDVETFLSKTWVAQVQAIFEDATIDGISGSLTFHDVPFTNFFSGIDLFFRVYLARSLARHQQLFLYGGNMAIRKTAWNSVKDELCRSKAQHEDLDLAAHMAGGKYKLDFDENLVVAISARRVDSDFATYCRYVLANSRTYRNHGLIGRFYMYPVIWLVIAFYIPLRVLYRSYDRSNGRFSLRLLLEPLYEQHVSPISE